MCLPYINRVYFVLYTAAYLPAETKRSKLSTGLTERRRYEYLYSVSGEFSEKFQRRQQGDVHQAKTGTWDRKGYSCVKRTFDSWKVIGRHISKHQSSSVLWLYTSWRATRPGYQRRGRACKSMAEPVYSLIDTGIPVCVEASRETT